MLPNAKFWKTEKSSAVSSARRLSPGWTTMKRVMSSIRPPSLRRPFVQVGRKIESSTAMRRLLPGSADSSFMPSHLHEGIVRAELHPRQSELGLWFRSCGSSLPPRNRQGNALHIDGRRSVQSHLWSLLSRNDSTSGPDISLPRQSDRREFRPTRSVRKIPSSCPDLPRIVRQVCHPKHHRAHLCPGWPAS